MPSLTSRVASLTDAERAELRVRVHETAWRTGNLRCLLHADQRMALDRIRAAPSRTFVLELARRWGKTYLCMALALEDCLRKPKVRVPYGAPTLKMLKSFVLPAFDKLAATAPEHMRPRFNSSEQRIECHNGSYVDLFGADDKRKADRGAGNDAVRCIFDEAGAEGVASMMRYIVGSIYGPSLQFLEGSPNGSIVLASTPARSPDHEFTEMTEQAEVNGSHLRRTVHDNPRLTEAQKLAFIEADAKDAGLTVEAYMRTDTFRREYLAERIVDKVLVVLPEWAEKRALLFKAIERPEFFRGMSTLDFGGHDPHGVHLGYWHHALNAYVIEYEDLMVSPCNTLQMQKRIKALEAEAWGVKAWEGTMAAARDSTLRDFQDRIPVEMAGLLQAQIDGDGQPWMRVADNDLQLVRDLYETHGLAFVPTAKDDKQLQVNNLQVAINREQVYVHPRCVHTDRHWRTTTWADHTRKTYARRGGEHGEFVDTGVYALRNIDKRDPTPEDARPVLRNATVGASIRAELKRHESSMKTTQQFLGNTPLGRKLMRGMR
jgi:hypothetical protein